MKGEQLGMDAAMKRKQWGTQKATRSVRLDCANRREAVFALTVEVIGGARGYVLPLKAMRRAAKLARGMRP